MSIYKALTIAGSDSGGGAGIQADIKTFQELGVYGMSVLTAITAQNTLGVQGIYPLELEAVSRQLDSIGEDLQPDAVKTGMLFSPDMVCVVTDKAQQYHWRNLVVDPVMIAKDGSPLLLRKAMDVLIRRLLPLALIVTPNIPEAELLAGMTIITLQQREEAARRLLQMGTSYVIIKGGHAGGSERAVDLLYNGHDFMYLESKRINTPHTHGTGCTYSAAITAGLAQGYTVVESIQTAKLFIQAAIEDGLEIGGGQGPTNHFAYQRRMRGAESDG